MADIPCVYKSKQHKKNLYNGRACVVESAAAKADDKVPESASAITPPVVNWRIYDATMI
ncbi:hypothetical protein LguiA_003606 [Lonicera macranthoides]